MYTRTLAVEWARSRRNVICVALHPGTTDTDLSRPFQANVPAGKLFDVDVRRRAAARRDRPPAAGGLGQFFAWDGNGFRGDGIATGRGAGDAADPVPGRTTRRRRQALGPAGASLADRPARDPLRACRSLRDQLGQRVYTVHRLDKGTSGALVFALDPGDRARVLAAISRSASVDEDVSRAGARLAAGGRHRRSAAAPAVEDDAHRRRNRPSRARRARRSRASPRSSCRCASIATRPRATRWCELAPHTGRRHQLRRHLAQRVASDRRRLDLRQGPAQPAVSRAVRRAAPAARVHAPATSRHPHSGATLRIEAPLARRVRRAARPRLGAHYAADPLSSSSP